MAIPSGGGTEVLKNVLINGQNATNSTPLTVAQHHIITILSIIEKECGYAKIDWGNDEKM